MAASYEDKIREQAASYLEPGEHVLAAFIGQPRGATASKVGAGVVVSAIGDARQGKERKAAGEAGLTLANPMALALTESRLVVLSVSAPIAMGKGGDVKELVSSAPLGDVESIQVKRLLVGKTVHVTVRGQPFKLEAGAGANVKGLAEEFRPAKAV
jgi:hypothetical protein